MTSIGIQTYTSGFKIWCPSIGRHSFERGERNLWPIHSFVPRSPFRTTKIYHSPTNNSIYKYIDTTHTNKQFSYICSIYTHIHAPNNIHLNLYTHITFIDHLSHTQLITHTYFSNIHEEGTHQTTMARNPS